MITEAEVMVRLADATRGILSGLEFGDDLVDWPDVPFKVPANPTRYFEIRHFRTDPQSNDWAGDTRVMVGIWQISLIDFTQAGEVQPLTLLSQVADFFQKGQGFWQGDSQINITDPPSFLTVVQEGHKAIYPLSVRYRVS